MRIDTRLKDLRKARKIAASDLAHLVGVSRQTIYAIEDGTFVPNTTIALQLAHALGVTIEEIFSIADERLNEPVSAELLSRDPGITEGRLVRVCRVNKRLIAVPSPEFPPYLPAADGIIQSRKKLSVSVISSAPLPHNGKRLLLAGCDPALSALRDTLRGSEVDILTVACSSRCALQWLKNGKVHAAGSHLLDKATGDYNVPIVRRLLPESLVRVVTFAVWEQGLVLRRGNPKNIRSIADLTRKAVKLINREKGSGSRELLDTGLEQFGIRPEQVNGYDSVASGHLAAAYAVAGGNADCCIAPRAAARCFGLDFVPTAVHRFDLSFTSASLELPAAKVLLDVLTRSEFRKKLQCIAGYDTAHTGDVLV